MIINLSWGFLKEKSIFKKRQRVKRSSRDFNSLKNGCFSIKQWVDYLPYDDKFVKGYSILLSENFYLNCLVFNFSLILSRFLLHHFFKKLRKKEGFIPIELIFES